MSSWYYKIDCISLWHKLTAAKHIRPRYRTKHLRNWYQKEPIYWFPIGPRVDSITSGLAKSCSTRVLHLRSCYAQGSAVFNVLRLFSSRTHISAVFLRQKFNFLCAKPKIFLIPRWQKCIQEQSEQNKPANKYFNHSVIQSKKKIVFLFIHLV